MRTTALTVAFVLPTLALVQIVSAADPPSKPAEAGQASGQVLGGGAKKYDPDNVRGISQYMELLAQANAKLVAKDVPGAMALYRQAIPLAPRNPLGHFYLGAAYIAEGNLSEAEDSYKQAEGLSDDRNANLRGKILFAL